MHVQLVYQLCIHILRFSMYVAHIRMANDLIQIEALFGVAKEQPQHLLLGASKKRIAQCRMICHHPATISPNLGTIAPKLGLIKVPPDT